MVAFATNILIGGSSGPIWSSLLDYAPIAAAAFAIPQFLPQILKLRRTDDVAGVSWAWAALTSVNNAAWFAYFAASAYWAALVPSSSAALLSGTLGIMLARRGQAAARPAVLISAWAGVLTAVFAVGGRTGLGTLLTAAFVLQVTPSIWTAYRTDRPTGVSRGTWILVLGELSWWAAFGLYQSDPRLIVLGFTGVAASLLMLARIRRVSKEGWHSELRRHGPSGLTVLGTGALITSLTRFGSSHLGSSHTSPRLGSGSLERPIDESADGSRSYVEGTPEEKPSPRLIPSAHRRDGSVSRVLADDPMSSATSRRPARQEAGERTIGH